MPAPLRQLTIEQLADVRDATVAHYERSARGFWEGTRSHDVSQNIDALLRHLPRPSGCEILDLGCGPGRDLRTFEERGHLPIGLDAAPTFVSMARSHSGCEVWRQDLLELDLPPNRFDGIFANAVLFHVPSQELSRVLGELRACLRERGVLFCSNPRGPDLEAQRGERYGCFMKPETWCDFVVDAGFSPIEEYYRPAGAPEQISRGSHRSGAASDR